MAGPFYRCDGCKCEVPAEEEGFIGIPHDWHEDEEQHLCPSCKPQMVEIKLLVEPQGVIRYLQITEGATTSVVLEVGRYCIFPQHAIEIMQVGLPRDLQPGEGAFLFDEMYNVVVEGEQDHVLLLRIACAA